jgi:hypothetical protein
MIKKIFAFIILGAFMFFSSGCALVGAAASAAAAYGIYKATKK